MPDLFGNDVEAPDGQDPFAFDMAGPEVEVEDVPVGEEPQAEAEIPQEDAAEEPSAAEALLAGKYETPEALEEAYQKLKSTVGRQANELGELRAMRETMEQVLAWQQQQAQLLQQQQQPQYQPDLGEMIQEDPARAAEIAHQVGNQAALRSALQEWELVSPGAPRAWWAAKQNEVRLAQIEQRFEQTMGPIQQSAQEQYAHQVIANAAAAIPDFFDYKDEMAEVVEENGLAITAMLESGDPAKVQGTLNLLYSAAKARRNAGTLQQAGEVARVQAEESRRAREEAIVATATANVAEPAKPDDDFFGLRALDEAAAGWNI